MSNKSKVFLSSTFKDLSEERQEAIETILNTGYTFIGTGLSKARKHSQLQAIYKWIDESNVFILLFGGRYGSIEPKSNKSYTQLEYEYAIKNKESCHVIILDEEFLTNKVKDSGLTLAIEQNVIDRYELFKSEIQSNITHIEYVKNCSDLKRAIRSILTPNGKNYKFMSIYPYYKALKFAFEYGITNEYNMQKKILQSQQIKKYNTIIREIEEYYLNDIDQLEWNQLKYEKKTGRRRCRKIINKNGYNFMGDKYFNSIYTLYGLSTHGATFESSKNLSADDEDTLFSQFYTRFFLDANGSLKEEAKEHKKFTEDKSYTDAKKNVNDQNESKEVIAREVFFKEFKEKAKIEYDQNNKWDDMNKDNPNTSSALLDIIDFFSNISFLGALGYLLKQHIDFSTSIYKKRNYFYIRGFDIGYGLNQESIYRCLYAIHENKIIELRTASETVIKAIPIKVFFQHHNFYENDAYPYVQIYKIEHKQIVNIPLFKGVSISVTKHNIFKSILKHRKEKLRKITVNFFYNDVEQNGELTTYIEDKINSLWFQNRISENKSKKKNISFLSIYYENNKEWKVLEYTYIISDNDYNKFKQWILSFGEFAKIKSESIVKQQIYPRKFNNFFKDLLSLPQMKNIPIVDEDITADCKRTPENYIYSLLNPYDSIFRPKQFKKCYRQPTAQEVFWLKYILLNYPNLCNMIFESYQINPPDCSLDVKKTVLENITNRLASDLKLREGAFNPFEIDKQLSESKAHDIGKDYIKYSYILYAIRNNKFMKYKTITKEKIVKEKLVIPYSFEYNIVSSYKNKNAPFLIMMYDMNEKRITNVKPDKITVIDKNHESTILEKYELNTYEKLYHIIAFFVRVAYQKQDDKKNDAKVEVLQRFFSNDYNQKSNKDANFYNILNYILKNIECKVDPTKEKKVLRDWYSSILSNNLPETKDNIFLDFLITELSEFFDLKNSSEIDIKFIGLIEGAYKYIYDYVNEVDGIREYEKDLKKHGVAKIGQKELCYRITIFIYLKHSYFSLNKTEKVELNNLLEKIPTSDIYEIIAGNPDNLLSTRNTKSQILSKLNEISYINEQLKCSEITFILNKDFNEKYIDEIYDIFREFICLAEYNNADEIIFTIIYERFNYRKIHAGLLALDDCIKDISPKEVRTIIDIRKGISKK